MTQIELAILKQIDSQGHLNAKKISRHTEKIRDIKKHLVREGYIKTTNDNRHVYWLSEKGKQALNETVL